MNKIVQGIYMQVNGKVYESVKMPEGKSCRNHCDLFICEGSCIDDDSRSICITLDCVWKELEANE